MRFPEKSLETTHSPTPGSFRISWERCGASVSNSCVATPNLGSWSGAAPRRCPRDAFPFSWSSRKFWRLWQWLVFSSVDSAFPFALLRAWAKSKSSAEEKAVLSRGHLRWLDRGRRAATKPSIAHFDPECSPEPRCPAQRSLPWPDCSSTELTTPWFGCARFEEWEGLTLFVAGQPTGHWTLRTVRFWGWWGDRETDDWLGTHFAFGWFDLPGPPGFWLLCQFPSFYHEAACFWIQRAISCWIWPKSEAFDRDFFGFQGCRTLHLFRDHRSEYFDQTKTANWLWADFEIFSCFSPGLAPFDCLALSICHLKNLPGHSSVFATTSGALLVIFVGWIRNPPALAWSKCCIWQTTAYVDCSSPTPPWLLHWPTTCHSSPTRPTSSSKWYCILCLAPSKHSETDSFAISCQLSAGWLWNRLENTYPVLAKLLHFAATLFGYWSTKFGICHSWGPERPDWHHCSWALDEDNYLMLVFWTYWRCPDWRTSIFWNWRGVLGPRSSELAQIGTESSKIKCLWCFSKSSCSWCWRWSTPDLSYSAGAL